MRANEKTHEAHEKVEGAAGSPTGQRKSSRKRKHDKGKVSNADQIFVRIENAEQRQGYQQGICASLSPS